MLFRSAKLVLQESMTYLAHRDAGTVRVVGGASIGVGAMDEWMLANRTGGQRMEARSERVKWRREERKQGGNGPLGDTGDGMRKRAMESESNRSERRLICALRFYRLWESWEGCRVQEDRLRGRKGRSRRVVHIPFSCTCTDLNTWTAFGRQRRRPAGPEKNNTGPVPTKTREAGVKATLLIFGFMKEDLMFESFFSLLFFWHSGLV